MDSNEYIEKAIRTESKNYSFGSDEMPARIEHAIMGIVTEAGELMDDVKKTKIYNKPLDKNHLIEELGDVMWYSALLVDALGISFEEVWDTNIKKLRIRYPEKYTDELALNRNLDEEKRVLGTN